MRGGQQSVMDEALTSIEQLKEERRKKLLEVGKKVLALLIKELDDPIAAYFVLDACMRFLKDELAKHSQKITDDFRQS